MCIGYALRSRHSSKGSASHMSNTCIAPGASSPSYSSSTPSGSGDPYTESRKKTMLILLSLVLIIPLLWMTGFLLVTDFSVPLRDARQFKNVLVIFPHADDEAITCGGSLHHITKGRSAV